MNYPLAACICMLWLTPGAHAEPSVPFAADLPPVIGVAVVASDDSDRANDEWAINLTLPKAAWKVVGEVIPKREWPKLHVDVERVTRTLRMDGPSALSPSRIVDFKGRELTSEEVRKRLAAETPVLVSVTGWMVDSYYLQLTVPDALIVILGPRDGSPSPELLPAASAATDVN
jgi:hypothetical protein